jgi:hypothetical protein
MDGSSAVAGRSILHTHTVLYLWCRIGGAVLPQADQQAAWPTVVSPLCRLQLPSLASLKCSSSDLRVVPLPFPDQMQPVHPLMADARRY